MTLKLKKGDKVMVIAGKDRGKVSTILRVLPKKQRVVLEGVNLVKRHRKPTARSRKGQIVSIAMPIHVSNVMLIDPKSGKPTRVGIRREGDARVRIAKKSGERID